jgi:hypothetical protein
MFWLSRTLSLLVLVVLVGLSQLGDPVFAQGNEEKAELAQRVMELYKQEGYLERAFEGAVRSVPAGQKEAMEEAISKADQDAIYAGWAEKIEEFFTIEEIKAYLDYVSSDLGRSNLRKSTEFNFAMQEVLVLEIMAGMSED